MPLKNGSIKILFKSNRKKAPFKNKLLIWPSILVLLGLIVYPMGAVLLQSFFPNLFTRGFQNFSLQSFATIFSSKYTYHAIINGFLLGLGTAVITSVLGSFFAVIVHRKWVYGTKIINVIVWLVFFTPSYLMAMGWVLMMENKGVLMELFHLPDGSLKWFFSPAGLVAAMSFRLFPMVYLSVRAGLQGIGSDFENAARVQGASSVRLWFKIVVPLLMPAILAGGTITFAESISDFGFAAALVPQAHIPLITYSIFTSLNQMPVNYSEAGALSFILIGIIALAVWSQKWILGRGSYSTIQNQIRPYRSNHKPSVLWTFIAFAVLFLIFAVPMVGEVATSFLKNSSDGFVASNISLVHYVNVLAKGSNVGHFIPSIWRSIKLALLTTLAVTFLGVVLAYVIQKSKGLTTRLLYVLTMSTLAIPGIILAAAYVFAWNAPFLVPFHLNFYGTIICLFLAYVAGALPNSIRLQMAAITQISPSLLQAGQVHGAKIFTVFRKILLPLVASTTISTLFLIFSHVMFELPASLLLYLPNQAVLPVLVHHYFIEMMIGDGSAATVLGIAIVLVVYGLGQLLILGSRRGKKQILLRTIVSKNKTVKETSYAKQKERRII